MQKGIIVEHKVGDYVLQQFSMWEFKPEGSLGAYRYINNSLTGKDILLSFYVTQVVEVVSDRHWKVRNVMADEPVNDDLKKFLDSKGAFIPQPSHNEAANE